MTKPKLHMVGNAHIDPVWLWRWQDGLEVVLSTCRDAVALLKRYPCYVFSRSSAGAYKWLEQTDPQTFEEIRRLVTEERWNIVNGWWEQPDCNIPCGESLIRQGLYGQLYFLEKFGKAARVGYNVDTFGHCGTLPQILRKCGLEYYVFSRPGRHEKTLPNDLFRWMGPDGSQVLACRIEGYATGNVEGLERRIERALARCRETGMDWMAFYGRGDHGGGPTEEMILKIQELSAKVQDVDIVFSTPDSFFESVKGRAPDLPVVKDELQHHSRGCYTVVSEIKARNRKLETSLLNAEKFCSMASMLFGVQYPRSNLRQSWETLLFNQFHDVLAGTSIKPAYMDAFRALDVAEGVAGSARDLALAAFSARVRTVGKEGQQLLVFNPAYCEREDPVEFQAVLPPGGDLVALDEKGGKHPIQILSSEKVDGNRLVSGVFVARLPALGYRVFWITQGKGPAASDLQASSNGVENTFVRISVDPKSGFIASIFDKRMGAELLASPSRFVVIRDESDTWSHDVASFRDEIGTFDLERPPIVRAGPVRASLTIFGRHGRSKVIQTYIVHAGIPLVECRIDLDWHEKHKMLKLSFPVAVQSPTATYEIPYGIMRRATTGEEEPGQRWLDVSGRSDDGSRLGLLLINDCKYGFDVLGSEMRISLVRSPIYAFHAPRKVEPGKRYLYTDQGRQSIKLGLLAHAGFQPHVSFAYAERLNNPPIIPFSNAHDGPLPSTSSLLKVSPRNVVLGALKMGERDESVVLRLFESAGRRTKSKVRFPLWGLEFSFPLAPWEIKTVKISKAGRATETNMLEMPPASGS